MAFKKVQYSSLTFIQFFINLYFSIWNACLKQIFLLLFESDNTIQLKPIFSLYLLLHYIKKTLFYTCSLDVPKDNINFNRPLCYDIFPGLLFVLLSAFWT